MLTVQEQKTNCREILEKLLSTKDAYRAVYGIQVVGRGESSRVKLLCINKFEEIEDITHRVSVVLNYTFKDGWLITKVWNTCVVSHFVDALNREFPSLSLVAKRL